MYSRVDMWTNQHMCKIPAFSVLSGFREAAVEQLLLSARSQTCLHPQTRSSSVSHYLMANLYQISTLIPWMPEDQHDGLFKTDTKTHLTRGSPVKLPAPLHGFLLRFQKTITQRRGNNSKQTKLQLHRLNRHAIKCIFQTTKANTELSQFFMRTAKTKNITRDFLAICGNHHGELVDHQRYNQPLKRHSQLCAAQHWLLFMLWFPFWQSCCW